ncbi:MAG TPA: multidrug ABC transporter substrate-binding protein [Fibrobacteres bacterium]|jgi:putative ABC transport system permease protein|nr:multidrug ABC transporter substrate-binding protein [Fibrobacterota bacterium]
MNFFSLFKIAIKSIVKNRMRTLLTMLGIIIGVAAVISMVSIGQGAQKKIEAQISSMGTNLLDIFPGAGRFGGVHQTINKMQLVDVEKIIQQAPAVGNATAVVSSSAQVIAGTNNTNTSIKGVSPDYFTIRAWSLLSGNMYTDNDDKNMAKVAILGKTVVDNLFPDKEDPLGSEVRIRNVPFKVIGVLNEKGSSAGPGGDQDDCIYAPTRTVLNRISGGRNINMIMASARSQDAMDSAQAQITAILRKQHNLHTNDSNDFHIMNQTEIISMATQSTQVFTLLLASIAGVSLIVGGIGIMNIMLVSVTERTREIGIRLAIGARGNDILVQFIVEAAVLSMIGGLIGILLGVSASFIINPLFSMPVVISPGIIILSFVFSAAIGVFFGYYPARRASAMNPIEALRYE